MNSQESFTQLTFHYFDGKTETFNIYEPAEVGETDQELRQRVRRVLEKPWWILHLPDQTLCINMAHVVKVEIKPAIPHLQGENVFSDAQRVTALSRTL